MELNRESRNWPLGIVSQPWSVKHNLWKKSQRDNVRLIVTPKNLLPFFTRKADPLQQKEVHFSNVGCPTRLRKHQRLLAERGLRGVMALTWHVFSNSKADQPTSLIQNGPSGTSSRSRAPFQTEMEFRLDRVS